MIDISHRSDRIPFGPAESKQGMVMTRGEQRVESSGYRESPPLVAVLVRLQLRGRSYWYAMLYRDPPIDEDPAYRHGTAHPLYDHRDALIADLVRDGIPIDEDATASVEVDRARAVIGYEMSRDDMNVVITAWNSLDDLAKAIGVPLGFSGRLANRCYDKLFWGLNLEAVTPPGQRYVPSWRPRELEKIDQVLREGETRITRGAPTDR